MPLSEQQIQALAGKAVNYVTVSSLAMKRAMDEVEVHRALQKKAAALQDSTLEYLISHGVIGKHQKEAAAAMLATHDGTLNLVKLAADGVVAARQKAAAKNGLGGGVDDPNAPGAGGRQKVAYDSLTDPVVGRRTSQRKASDEAILAVLNPPPGR